MAGNKILVVEDSPSVLEMVRDGLVDAGYDVVAVTNGFEALRDLEEVRPDLIVTDIQMPKVDGLEFCQAMKSRLETRQIPFIIMSSLVDADTVRQGRLVGAKFYIAKPFEIEKLLESVRKILG
jgi:CheY-like chemotaxis protein